MFTVYDYLKYYQNTSLDEVAWNVIDNLVCAILVYLPVNSFDDKKKLLELIDYWQNNMKNSGGVMAPKALDVLKLASKAKRYANLEISNFINIRNDSVQFGAATFKNGNETIISFKGTESSFIGWLENFRLFYEYPTYTQQLAIDYLKNSISLLDKNIYVVGHSKGGNLAMASVMELSNILFNKVKAVYNFDGPGFRLSEFESTKYKRLSNKLFNIIPAGSMIGTILYNDNYQVILSTEKAINEHYPTSWRIFGTLFQEGKLSGISMQFHKNTTEGINKLEKEKFKEAIEIVFQSFGREYASDLKLNFNDLKNFYRNMRNVDPTVKKYIDRIIEVLIKFS